MKNNLLKIIRNTAKFRARNLDVARNFAFELIAREAGFSDYHELTTAYKRNKELPKLYKAAFGFSELADVFEINHQELYPKLEHLLSNDDQLISYITDTNALNYSIDTYEIISAEYSEETGILTLEMGISYDGDQDEDRPFSGRLFYISLSANFVQIKGEWTYYNPNSIDILEITPEDYGDNEL